jgi:hypothetical protein
MSIGKSLFAVAFLIALALAAPSAPAQSAPANCTASQKAAVECFVANAVSTKLTTPRYGMTVAQFENYGYAVSQILQTRHTYLVLVALSSAVADAMPPTNANGTANQAAQTNAVTSMVAAASRLNFISLASGTTLTDLEHFSLDVTSAMNDNSGMMELLTPGVSLRIIDSYIATSKSGSQVNWTEVNSSLTAAVNHFISSGLMKMPPGMNTAQVSSFAEELAHAIYTYEAATGRTSLRAD